MRKVVFGVAIVSVPYLFFALFMYFIQDNILFQPQPLPADYEFSFNAKFKEFNVITPDSASLNALHFYNPNPKGVILYFHGNAGNLARWGGIASGYVQYGYDVIVMDYRSYGKSTGSPNQESMYADAQLFYNYAKQHYPEDDILVYGRSLGTSVSTFLAAQNNPERLILETPFYSIKDVANTRFRYLPVQWLLKYDFPSYKYAPLVNCPALILHGTNDAVVPYSSGKRLYESFAMPNAELITIAKGKHNNLNEFETFNEAISRFLKVSN